MRVTSDDGAALRRSLKWRVSAASVGAAISAERNLRESNCFCRIGRRLVRPGRYTVDVKRHMAFFDSKPKSSTFLMRILCCRQT